MRKHKISIQEDVHVCNFLWEQLILELVCIVLKRMALRFSVMRLGIFSNESQQHNFFYLINKCILNYSTE